MHLYFVILEGKGRTHLVPNVYFSQDSPLVSTSEESDRLSIWHNLTH